MANLIGNVTEFGEKLYLSNLLNNVKEFVLIGSAVDDDTALDEKLAGGDLLYEDIEENIFATLEIPFAGYDNSNQAFFDCIVPYDIDYQKFIYAIGLIYDDNGVKRLADWAFVNKLFKTAQVGGTYKYLVSVTGESGSVLFKNTDFITKTELEIEVEKLQNSFLESISRLGKMILDNSEKINNLQYEGV